MYSYFDYLQSQMPRYQSQHSNAAKIITSLTSPHSRTSTSSSSINPGSPSSQTTPNHHVNLSALQLPLSVANALQQHHHPLSFQHTPSVSPVELSPDTHNHNHNHHHHYLLQQDHSDGGSLSPVLVAAKSAARSKKTKDVDGKSKRIRTCYTPYQLKVMEESFACQIYLVNESRINLATELNLTETQVKVWFQNRRIKQRKLDAIAESRKLTSSQ